MTEYNSIFDLTGRVAVVTGGAGFLGRHFCKALSDHGAHVVVVDQEIQSVEEVASGLNGESMAAAIDLREEEHIADLVAKIVARFGRLDILHNNAACKPKELRQFFKPVEQFQMDVWREIMSVNIDAMFCVAKHAGGYMAAHGGGAIIQTGSIYGLVGPDQRVYKGSDYLGGPINTPAVYSASKAAVVGLTKHLATYWAEKGVRVNTLTPGGVESGQNDVFVQKYSARTPLNRMAKPKDMVGALVFLASDAAEYITGQNITIDGGLTAW